MFTEYGDEQDTDPKDLKLKEVKVSCLNVLHCLISLNLVQPTEKYIPRSSSSFSASESSYASLGLKKPLDRSESIIEAARRQQELQVIVSVKETALFANLPSSPSRALPW